MTHPQDAANDLLMSGGIAGIKWKDNPVGYTVVGTIVDQPKAVQMTKYESTDLDFWPSGDPKMEIVVTIATDLRDPANAYDDGKRRLHIPPRMMPPVREAVQKAGATGLAIGGRIAVRRIGGTGVAGSPFEFAADYAAPVVDPGSLLANGNGNGNGNGEFAGVTTRSTQTLPPMAAPTASPTLGSMLAGNNTTTAADAVPPGVDPQVWEGLPPAQKQAIRAAMSNPAASAPPF